MANTDLSDEQIVEIILNNDKELYREIIRRYQDKLSHFLRKFIYDKDEMEDVLQVVFIKTYKNLYGFDVHRKFSSWIYRIAHNEAVNFLKKTSRNGIFLDDLEYKIIDEKIDICGNIDNKMLKKEIERNIAKLKIKYQEPLILFYFEDRSYEEISDILRIPKSTVGTLIARGKKMLKNHLEETNKNHG
jgi:RNA polymerase sigma-70 factor (ECF subfamily)